MLPLVLTWIVKDNTWIGYERVVGYTGLTYTIKIPKMDRQLDITNTHSASL